MSMPQTATVGSIVRMVNIIFRGELDAAKGNQRIRATKNHNQKW